MFTSYKTKTDENNRNITENLVPWCNIPYEFKEHWRVLILGFYSKSNVTNTKRTIIGQDNLSQDHCIKAFPKLTLWKYFELLSA